jgi:hypothetical protein
MFPFIIIHYDEANRRTVKVFILAQRVACMCSAPANGVWFPKSYISYLHWLLSISQILIYLFIYFLFDTELQNFVYVKVFEVWLWVGKINCNEILTYNHLLTGVYKA